MKLKFLIVFLFLSPFVGFSQNTTLKIGYTDVGYILTNLPQFKQIESDLKAHNTQLQNTLEAKVKDLREKAAKFEKESPTLTDVIKNDRLKELQTLEQSIQEFQQNAQNSSQQKERTLLQPQYERIQKAIDEVRVENAFDFIFNANPEGLSVILSADEKKYNVSDLVFKKLGVTPPAPGTANSTAAPGAKPAGTGASGTGTGTGAATTTPKK